MADPLRSVSTPTPLHIPKEDDFDPDALLEECLADLDSLTVSSAEPAPPPSTAPKLEDPLGENSQLEEVKKQLQALLSNPPDLIDSLVRAYKTDSEQLRQQIVEGRRLSAKLSVIEDHPLKWIDNEKAFFVLQSEAFQQKLITEKPTTESIKSFLDTMAEEKVIRYATKEEMQQGREEVEKKVDEELIQENVKLKGDLEALQISEEEQKLILASPALAPTFLFALIQFHETPGVLETMKGPKAQTGLENQSICPEIQKVVTPDQWEKIREGASNELKKLIPKGGEE